MTTVYLAPTFGAGYQSFTNGGLPNRLGLIYTYIAGGTTPQATYTTVAGSVQNANPIQLDAFGRPPSEIWLTSAAYRFDVKDSLGNLIKTYDDLSGINSTVLSASTGSANVGTIQAGTGAVAETTQAALRRHWYPEQFGAVGDGVADDSAAWALLITAVGSSNFEIHGAPGKIYGIGAGGITFTSLTNGRVFANGAKIKILAVATQTVATFGFTSIKVDSCTQVGFEGWSIDGNAKATNIIGVVNSTECSISKNKVSSGGLLAHVVAAGNIRNIYDQNICKSGTGTARGLWIGNTGSGEQETDALILGNTVVSMGGSGIGGLRYGGRIEGNHCLSNAGSGIVESGLVSSGIISHGVAIVGNTCRLNTFHGIQPGDLTGWTSNSDNVYNISITGNQCHGNTGSGIYANLTRDSAITGNVCTDNGTIGINVGQSARLAISGNVCYDTRAGGSRTQQKGIDVVAQVAALDVTDITVTGNTCYNHTQYGIRGATSTPGTINGLVIVGNICVSNTTQGIDVANDAAASILGVVVAGNKCSANGTSDMRIDNLDAVIQGNKYLTMTGTGAFAFTNGDTTPSVLGREYFVCTNSGPTTITMFDDGVPGQAIEILFTDANTTLTDGGNLKLAGAFTGSADDVMRLRFNGTNWYEVCRSVN